jgi:hypothetical protein
MANQHEDEDSDLADLLPGSKVQDPAKRVKKQQQQDPQPRVCDLNCILDYITTYISLFCYYYPGVCAVFVLILVGGLVMLLTNLMFNPIEHFGVIKNDFSNVRSKYDLTMGKIDHWCLEGGDQKCDCEDPLVPMSRIEHKSWILSFNKNKDTVKELAETELDVAFLGGDIVEEMNGRWMGETQPQLKQMSLIFKNHFSKANGASIEGVALGIAGKQTVAAFSLHHAPLGLTRCYRRHGSQCSLPSLAWRNG